MTTRQQFWATKSTLPEYESIVFTHDDFPAPIRLVANQFAPVTLGGYVHTPCPMSVTPPDQSSEPIASLKLTFPRAVVGRTIRDALSIISIGGRLKPITVRWSHYIGSDLTTPALAWTLYIAKDGGIAFTSSSVQVTATDDNPMRRDVSSIYDPAVFTGLESV